MIENCPNLMKTMKSQLIKIQKTKKEHISRHTVINFPKTSNKEKKTKDS